MASSLIFALRWTRGPLDDYLFRATQLSPFHHNHDHSYRNAMSGTSTPERDAGLLAIGTQCAAPTCMLVDFLPIKCQHCSHAFCSEHFLPEAHKCDKFDAHLHNRVAPPCPFCSTPIAIPPGQDPNIKMEAHFNTECVVLTGQGRKSAHPTCARAKCGKVLYAPIRCDVSTSCYS